MKAKGTASKKDNEVYEGSVVLTPEQEAEHDAFFGLGKYTDEANRAEDGSNG